MNRRTLTIIAIGVGIVLLFQFLRVAARGQPLAEGERREILASANRACIADLERAGRGNVAKAFCDCFATRVVESLTRVDLGRAAVTPDLQRRRERAAADCVHTARPQ